MRIFLQLNLDESTYLVSRGQNPLKLLYSMMIVKTISGRANKNTHVTKMGRCHKVILKKKNKTKNKKNNKNTTFYWLQKTKNYCKGVWGGEHIQDGSTFSKLWAILWIG